MKLVKYFLLIMLLVGCNNSTESKEGQPQYKSIAEKAFITTWKTDNNITIPTIKDGYNYSIEWGDGKSDNNVKGDITHNYESAGEYTVKITGEFPRIYFRKSGADRKKILSVEQWGDIGWKSMSGAFYGCRYLHINAIDKPNLSEVTDMKLMFYRAYSFNEDISSWDVSNVTNMRLMFGRAYKFNQDISAWDVSKVENMQSMFYYAYNFKQDIDSWNVSNVKDMSYMFARAGRFNRSLNSWDVSKVTNMKGMFSRAYAFNQDISSWNVSNVENMEILFYQAKKFNQPLDAWNVSKVKNMRLMFGRAYDFNQDIGSWNVSKVENMQSMFYLLC